jgi:hypothetical protein
LFTGFSRFLRESHKRLSVTVWGNGVYQMICVGEFQTDRNSVIMNIQEKNHVSGWECEESDGM